MPLATPTAIDGWSTNHSNNHARSGAIAIDQAGNSQNKRVQNSHSHRPIAGDEKTLLRHRTCCTN